MYIGGSFVTVGLDSRVYLAAIDMTTGLATGWNPSPDASIQSLVLNGSTIYVGGGFANIGGQARTALAEIDISTGLATAFDLAITGSVSALAVNGLNLYIGGTFSTVSGVDRLNAAKILISSSAVLSWVVNPTAAVYALAGDGTDVAVGGSFVLTGATRRDIAAFDGVTGAVTSFHPVIPGGSTIYMAVDGSTLYIASDFVSVNGDARSGIAAVDTVTGATLPWSPTLDSYVNSIVVSGSSVFIAGAFATVNGTPRNGFAEIDKNTGTLLAWDPGATVGGLPATGDQIIIDGNTVYVSGNFDTIGGQARAYIAAINKTTSLATSWSPVFDGSISSLYVQESELYVTGGFLNIDANPRTRFAKFSTVTGLLDAWSPVADNEYSSRIIPRGATTYLTGGFTTMNGIATSGSVTSVDSATGTVTRAWNPNFSATGAAYTVGFSNTYLYVGGDFLTISNRPHFGFVRFRLADTTVTQTASSTDVAEGGATDTYSIVLTNAPDSDVTVSISPDAQVTTSAASLVFTSGNWNTPQTITVTAVRDPVEGGLHTGLISHAITSLDADYDALSISNVTVNITDGAASSGTSGFIGKIGPPTVLVSYPNESATFNGGDETDVRWVTSGRVDLVNIAYSPDGGGSWVPIINLFPNQDVYRWTLPTNFSSTVALLRVEATDSSVVFASDVSDEMFTIYNPSSTVIITEPVTPDVSSEVEQFDLCTAYSTAAESGFSPVTGLTEVVTPTYPGQVIKSPFFENVYYITATCERRPYISREAYLTYFPSFDNVIPVTDATLTELVLGSPINHRPHSVIVSVQSTEGVYVVEEGGSVTDPIFRKIRDDDLVERIYGENWREYVVILPPTFKSKMWFGDMISNPDYTVDKTLLIKRSDIIER
jgi:hypothetical protein